MYKRPYVTALCLATMGIVGIVGQMLTAGLANAGFLCLSIAPFALALACLRRSR